MTGVESRGAKVRTLEEIQTDFRRVHGEASSLMTEADGLEPSIALFFSLKELKSLEHRIDQQLEILGAVDRDLLTHAGAQPRDYSAGTMHAARISAQASVRDSARSMLSHADGALGTLRNELYFRRSFVLGVLALLVFAVAIVIDVLGN